MLITLLLAITCLCCAAVMALLLGITMINEIMGD